MASRPEKCTRRVQFHFTDSLWFALLQASHDDDRKPSQFVRHVLAADPRVKKYLQGFNNNSNTKSDDDQGGDAVFLRRPIVAKLRRRGSGR